MRFIVDMPDQIARQVGMVPNGESLEDPQSESGKNLKTFFLRLFKSTTLRTDAQSQFEDLEEQCAEAEQSVRKDVVRKISCELDLLKSTLNGVKNVAICPSQERLIYQDQFFEDARCHLEKFRDLLTTELDLLPLNMEIARVQAQADFAFAKGDDPVNRNAFFNFVLTAARNNIVKDVGKFWGQLAKEIGDDFLKRNEVVFPRIHKEFLQKLDHLKAEKLHEFTNVRLKEELTFMPQFNAGSPVQLTNVTTHNYQGIDVPDADKFNGIQGNLFGNPQMGGYVVRIIL